MNQHQRKFLLESIEKQYKKELDELREQEPDEPSLNNYLIASVLDGTFKMKPEKVIREAMRQRVQELGKNKSLVNNRSWDNDEDHQISLPALLLFEEPPTYTESRKIYEVKYAEWSRQMKNLESSINAMRIKIQVGSDKSLQALVDQADRICSISLTAANQLLITNGQE